MEPYFDFVVLVVVGKIARFNGDKSPTIATCGVSLNKYLLPFISLTTVPIVKVIGPGKHFWFIITGGGW